MKKDYDSASSTDRVKVKHGGHTVKPFSIPNLILLAALMYSGWYLSNQFLALFDSNITLTGSFSSQMGYSKHLLWFAGIALIIVPVLLLFASKPVRTGWFLLLLLLHSKSCIVEKVRLSGKSMEPTYTRSDTLWIEKWSTGIYVPELGFPVGPPFQYSKFPKNGISLPERKSVVVFRYPDLTGNYQHWIKRTIALPGESFEFKKGKVYINGEALKEPYLAPYTLTNYLPDTYEPNSFEVPADLKDLSASIVYSSLHGCGQKGVVPANSILVLGDNRAVSRDSRTIGFIPLFLIEGVALTR